MEDDGFNGHKIRVELLKSRTNSAGQATHLVFNQMTGYDPILSLLEYANDYGLTEGRNPYRYFVNNKDVKFSSKKFKETFLESKELRDTMMAAVVPSLESILSKVDNEEETEYRMSMDDMISVVNSL